MTLVIGLTGGIATGKSAAARVLRRMHIPVFDADKTVHELMQPGHEIYRKISETFPSVSSSGIIDRAKLGAIIFKDKAQREKLENIIHPAVREAEIAFILRAKLQHRPIIVLDIPLLFETGADQLCDEVWLMHCPAFLQRQRAMQRKGMTQEKFDSIVSRQLSSYEKRRLADVVITSGIGKGKMLQQIKQQLMRIYHA